jgi:hypothetical protein
MTTFTGKDDEDLHAYFSGVLKGRCGLRSTMGGQLDAMASAVVDGRRVRGVEYMPVKPEDRHANRDFEVTEDMLAAVRAIERMERVLDKIDRPTCNVLRAHYAEPTKAAFREVAVELGSEEQTHDLFKRSVAEDRGVRREARKELGAAQYRAKEALSRAQGAYADAVEAVRVEDTAARRAAFAEGLL